MPVGDPVGSAVVGPGVTSVGDSVGVPVGAKEYMIFPVGTALAVGVRYPDPK